MNIRPYAAPQHMDHCMVLWHTLNFPFHSLMIKALKVGPETQFQA